MNFFDTVSGRITKAVDYIVEKNRKAALINRIRIVIKNERENEARAYVALGKYYFQHNRKPDNEDTENLCKAIENSDRRIKKAFDKLDEITACDEAEQDTCSDCDYCSPYDRIDNSDIDNEDDVTSNQYPTNFPIVDKANERGSASEEEAEEADAFSEILNDNSYNEEAADDDKGNPFV